MANILVIGGAGYVGSSVCAWLLDSGHDVTVIDDLSTGRRELILADKFVQARAGDRLAVERFLKSAALKSALKPTAPIKAFDCVMHFAGSAIVAESFEKRDEYFENNLAQTELLVATLLESGINKFIFSSSCSVFGNSNVEAVDELQEKRPMSPYGESKLAAEIFLENLTKTKNLECIVLRYFNAAGAEPGLRVGEWHTNETRLIPNVLKAALEQTELPIWGTDYPTPDGTCIRDYVHVWDLAAAHSQALNLILQGSTKFETFNLGSGKGFSVREIIQSAEELTGRKIRTSTKPRRIGDPSKLIASIEKAKRLLEFQPRLSSLESIMSSAWEWTKKRNEY